MIIKYIKKWWNNRKQCDNCTNKARFKQKDGITKKKYKFCCYNCAWIISEKLFKKYGRK